MYVFICTMPTHQRAQFAHCLQKHRMAFLLFVHGLVGCHLTYSRDKSSQANVASIQCLIRCINKIPQKRESIVLDASSYKKQPDYNVILQFSYHTLSFDRNAVHQYFYGSAYTYSLHVSSVYRDHMDFQRRSSQVPSVLIFTIIIMFQFWVFLIFTSFYFS